MVIMAADPVIAYQGEISGYPASLGKVKDHPNSAHVRKYEQFIRMLKCCEQDQLLAL
jgi:hypothetical protein